MGVYSDILNEESKQTTPEQQKQTANDKDIKISNEISKSQDIKISNNQDDLFEAIRLVVKETGRNTSPLRVTDNENERMDDVMYALKKEGGIRTDKTQVVRIALNYILNDYEKNGKDSVLVNCLERLNA